jgi:hypothetical protein
MQTTEALLGLLCERGKPRLPLQRVYRQLYNPNLYVSAYGRIYRNAGSMTPGVTEETADSMSLCKVVPVVKSKTRAIFRWVFSE